MGDMHYGAMVQYCERTGSHKPLKTDNTPVRGYLLTFIIKYRTLHIGKLWFGQNDRYQYG